MADVFVLGSGFSRSISAAMPTVRDLAAPLRSLLSASGRPDLLGLAGDTEALLGHLSVSQPFLREDENLANRALFVQISRTLAQILSEAQEKALIDAMPPWLSRLIRKWESDKTALITLNYDLLVERAVNASQPYDSSTGFPVEMNPTIYAVPIQRHSSHPKSARPRAKEPGLRLAKLHGSLNWYYPGTTPFWGHPVIDVGLEPRDWSKDDWDKQMWRPLDAVDLERISEARQGLVPLIVPPIPVKSDRFDNEIMRALWAFARQTLENAGMLWVIGYSLPDSDLSMRALLATSVGGKRIGIVDPDADVVERFKRAIPSAKFEPGDYVTSVADFVDVYVPGPVLGPPWPPP